MLSCLMPEAHTLTSLLAYLKNHVKGQTHESHDVNDVSPRDTITPAPK